MLATLDSLIAQDRGGRRLFLFRQLWCLFVTMGSKCDDAQTAVFDSVLATAANDVDYSIIKELAAEADHLPYGLPVLAAALTGSPVTTLAMLPPLPTSIFEEPPIEMEAPNTAALDAPVLAAPLEAPISQDIKQIPDYGADCAIDQSPPIHQAVEDAVVGIQAAAVTVDRRSVARDPAADASNPVTMARKASTEELARIAELANLPEAITNVIVARGERSILAKALANQTAVFARSSLTTLAELAPSDRMIREALVHRRDLPEPIIERLLPFLSNEKRATLLTNGAQFSEAAAREALVQAQTDLLAAARSSHVMTTLDSCQAMLDQGQLNAGDVILLLARDLRVAELAHFIALKLQVREATAFNILSGRIDHAVAVLLKAMQGDGQVVDQVMAMRSRLGCRVARESRSAFMVAERYTPESALDLVRSMDRVIVIPADADEKPEHNLLADIDAILRRAA